MRYVARALVHLVTIEIFKEYKNNGLHLVEHEKVGLARNVIYNLTFLDTRHYHHYHPNTLNALSLLDTDSQGLLDLRLRHPQHFLFGSLNINSLSNKALYLKEMFLMCNLNILLLAKGS